MRTFTQTSQKVLMVMRLVGLCALVAISNSALAVPITTDLAITGTVALDGNTTIPIAGSQEATYSATSGGAALADLTCAVNCVTGSANATGFSSIGLTELGDGVGIVTAVSGSGAFAFNEFFLNDYTIDLMNNSLTDTFTVTFQIDFSQDASVTAVAAAKATLDVDLELPLPPVNVQFSFGDLDTTLMNFGPFSDSGIVMFDITLLPGESGMVEGRQDIEGIAVGGSYNINQNMFISVFDVMNLTPPPPPPPPTPVPEPSTMLLFGTGLLVMGYARRRKRKLVA